MVTSTNVNSNAFETMRVKFAVQVLSNTTSAAIRSICDTENNMFVRKNVIQYQQQYFVKCSINALIF